LETDSLKKRVLIFIVSFKAEEYISSVLARIPENVRSNPCFDVEVLVIDDESGDQTFQRAEEFANHAGDLKITVLHNPKNQGYGGNQKIGYHYAIKMGFDAVILLHGDGQYPPEYIAQMVIPLLDHQADAVFGSRMINKCDALQGGMPVYKWIGNQVLTKFQNLILHANLAEFHTGYRAYSVDALKTIPFHLNSNYFDFDTEIIIQLLDTHKHIKEIPIPTTYGSEISRVNGIRYGALILKTSILSRLMRAGIFYDPKFDYIAENEQYVSKFGFDSSHQYAIERILPNSTVLDLGCGPGVMAAELIKKQARTISVDKYITQSVKNNSAETIEVDLDDFEFDFGPDNIDTILMLDIIEHLREPEETLRRIRRRYSGKAPQIILTTGNVGFLPIRLALLIGQFNYGKRGILDLDHTRLFTFYSLRRILNQRGFEILEEHGVPAPFILALGNNRLARFLMGVNRFLIKISKNLFAYQVAVIAKPTPTLEVLLERAVLSGKEKASEFAHVAQAE
jgi:glycosyltransferase involved in cell wall biosynthesis